MEQHHFAHHLTSQSGSSIFWSLVNRTPYFTLISNLLGLQKCAKVIAEYWLERGCVSGAFFPTGTQHSQVRAPGFHYSANCDQDFHLKTPWLPNLPASLFCLCPTPSHYRLRLLKCQLLTFLQGLLLFVQWCKLRGPHRWHFSLSSCSGWLAAAVWPRLWLVLIMQTSGNHLSALRHTNRMIYRPGLCVFLNLI